MTRLPLLLFAALIGCGSEQDLAPTHLTLSAAQARPLTDRTFEATPDRLDASDAAGGSARLCLLVFML